MEKIEWFITFITSSLTGIITYAVGHQRAKKEVENLSLHNLEKSIEIYNIIIGDMKEQIGDLLKKVDELELKIDDLMKENHSLKIMLEKQKK